MEENWPIQAMELDASELNEIRKKTLQKLCAEIRRNGSSLPVFPVEGHYRDCMLPSREAWWTNGFWPGIIWLVSCELGERDFQIIAREAGKRIAAVLNCPEKLDHDVGFLFVPSAVLSFRVLNHGEDKKTGLKAADFLRSRFREKGEYIEAWDEGTNGLSGNGNSLIADCMMNLSLLYWASEVSGDPIYAQTADRHCRTSLKLLIREDGSANHIVRIDPQTGGVLEIPAGQGYAPGSSWSRGQGWILYGFTNAYRHSGRTEYLEAAKRSAHYCIAAMAASGWLPKVDFRAPMDDGRYDSTGGMVIASGLTALASVLPEEERPLYRIAAWNILKVCVREYADWNPETDGIMTCGSTMYHNDRMGERAFMYTDFFLLETVLRLTGESVNIW